MTALAKTGHPDPSHDEVFEKGTLADATNNTGRKYETEAEKISSEHRELKECIRSNHRPEEPTSAGINDLPPEVLKPILGLLDCDQLLNASQVCRRWCDTVNEILEETTLKGTSMTHSKTCQTTFVQTKPTSNVHLHLMVLHAPKISELQLPENQDPLLDLNIVANTCHHLRTLDLRGFTVDPQCLGRLAERNKEHLRKVTLPAGCDDGQLEALLQQLNVLQSSKEFTIESPRGTGRWFQELPVTLETMEISGLEAPLEQWPPQAGLYDLRHLSLRGCSGVTDSTLPCLPDLAPSLGSLLIADCPNVTVDGLVRLGRLPMLERLTLPASLFTDDGKDSVQDIKRLLLSLPVTLKFLDIYGPGAPLEPVSVDSVGEGLVVSISHVNDSTLSHLPTLGPRLKRLLIGDCPLVTASGLIHVASIPKLERLTLHGVSAGAMTNAAPNSTAAKEHWLQKLNESLKILDIYGPGASLEPSIWMMEEGLTVHIRQVTNSTLVRLPVLASGLRNLQIFDCPGITAGGLLHLGRLTKLTRLAIVGVSAGGITDAVLDRLRSCSDLYSLRLGDPRKPPETAIPAAAVSRLAVACRQLGCIFLHTTLDSSKAVLDALHQTYLGRVIYLNVPDPVYSQLQRFGNRVEVHQWK